MAFQHQRVFLRPLAIVMMGLVFLWSVVSATGNRCCWTVDPSVAPACCKACDFGGSDQLESTTSCVCDTSVEALGHPIASSSVRAPDSTAVAIVPKFVVWNWLVAERAATARVAGRPPTQPHPEALYILLGVLRR